MSAALASIAGFIKRFVPAGRQEPAQVLARPCERSQPLRQTGILPDQDIAALFEANALKSPRALDTNQIQPASLDLRLGDKAYRVRASFLPGPDHLVADKL